MSRETLLAQITADPRLPSPPGIAFQVLEKINSPLCTIGEISKLIGQDPALCGKFLKIVNSTLFGLSRPITSIQTAVTLLGLRRVRSLALSLSLPAMQGSQGKKHNPRRFWKLAVTSSIVARDLAQRLKHLDPDTEMVAALLCDLGMLILQEVYPEQYVQVLNEPVATSIKGQCDLEEKLFGVNHAEVSSYTLRNWRLPDDITQAILYHHRPHLAPPAVQERAFILYFSHRVAHLQLTVGLAVGIGEIMALASERFRMTDRDFQEFLEPLGERIDEFSRILGVDTGEKTPFPHLLAQATQNLTRLAVETSLDNVRAEGEKHQAQQELKKTEAALQQAEEKLRQAVKMEAIGRLAGGIAHDFNNLLTIIGGCGELLLGTLREDDSNRLFVEEIKKAADRASELTHQLLAFSRKQILVPKRMNLNDVVSGMQKLLCRLIGEDIQLSTTLAPGLHPVMVDPGQMDQVIMNLVLNARDAMPPGGKLLLETANVELDETYVAPLSNLKPGPFAMLAISDTGAGMSEEIKEKIFEPFFTTKGEGKGTGLGLATVHGIVAQSGGHIAVYSELGHGTTFKVYLPALLKPKEYTPPPSRPTPSKMGTETILLTEDEDSVRRTARLMLETFGYQVLEARDGLDAIQVCQEYLGHIHLLITDIVMPNLGGAEVAKCLTELRPGLKVLFTSGYTDDAVIRHGVLTSQAAFLQKPFTPQGLAAKVHEVLRGAPSAAGKSPAFYPPLPFSDSTLSPAN